MSKVAIVIDSTSNIPQEMVSEYSIQVMPQTLIWDQETYQDGIDITPDSFYSRLETSKTIPTTSQVTPAAFIKVFQDLIAQDCDILAVLISAKLSGTVQSALQAQSHLHTERIAVVDSNAASMSTGYLALLAARSAARGATLQECAALIEASRQQVGTLFVVDTLKYLHMGGRIGGATRFLGTALDLKPVLELVSGRIEPIERVRSKKRAVERILDLAEQRIAGRRPLHLGILHARAKDEAADLLERATQRFHPLESCLSEISPVVGVHTGPGTLGLAFVAGV
jgi:DegV family protein with EDD domain